MDADKVWGLHSGDPALKGRVKQGSVLGVSYDQGSGPPAVTIAGRREGSWLALLFFPSSLCTAARHLSPPAASSSSSLTSYTAMRWRIRQDATCRVHRVRLKTPIVTTQQHLF